MNVSPNPWNILGIHSARSPEKVFVRQDWEGELDFIHCSPSRTVSCAAATADEVTAARRLPAAVRGNTSCTLASQGKPQYALQFSTKLSPKSADSRVKTSDKPRKIISNAVFFVPFDGKCHAAVIKLPTAAESTLTMLAGEGSSVTFWFHAPCRLFLLCEADWFCLGFTGENFFYESLSGGTKRVSEVRSTSVIATKIIIHLHLVFFMDLIVL